MAKKFQRLLGGMHNFGIEVTDIVLVLFGSTTLVIWIKMLHDFFPLGSP